jgi:DNA-binding response OmpR family regulator
MARLAMQVESDSRLPLVERRPRLLLAEDDLEMRRLLAGALRQDGYEVVEVGDGVDLLGEVAATSNADAESAAFDIIVSDIRIPLLTGLDVLAILRIANRKTPVILITAFGDDETHAEAHELGAAAVFDKPLDLARLREAVRAAVPRC